METVYNKLVRDKIPAIIQAQGGTAVVRTVESREEYARLLREKLREETEEFIAAGTLDELVDVGEVMHALLSEMGVSVEAFQKARTEKLAEKGGFEKRLFLQRVEKPG
ncbi:nucleoside triphosphate pyrophosphohydrolase [Ruminococcaceae bacterium OttesenSCG-928-O06]|nr:nucleoside triphosphate pyrophosphohydrolase [Ruminococcaceae bacterium OttesenSCG-928-O06]